MTIDGSACGVSQYGSLVLIISDNDGRSDHDCLGQTQNHVLHLVLNITIVKYVYIGYFFS